MNKQVQAGSIEFVYGLPFSAQELHYKKLKILAMHDGRRYIEDAEVGGSTLFVARVHRDGSPDASFGTDGWRAEFLDVPGTNCRAAGCLLREDGGCIAALSGSTGFGLACFKDDGTLDQGFGQNGTAVYDLFEGQKVGAEDEPVMNAGGETQPLLNAAGGMGAVVPGEEGKFFGFVQGQFNSPSRLMRFRADGLLDAEFNGGGIVTVNHPSFYAIVSDIVPAAEGGVVVIGRLANSRTSVAVKLFFCRYRSDGSLDEGFGDDGFATFDSESAGIPVSSLLQMDLSHVTSLSAGGFAASGQIVTKNPYQYYGLVICVDSLGQPLESFNRARPVLFGLLGEVEVSFRFGGIVEQADGKLVVGGNAGVRSPAWIQDILVVRFNSNGSVDSSFGGQGWVRVRPYENMINFSEDVELDIEGKVLLAGSGGPTDDGFDMRGFVLQFD